MLWGFKLPVLRSIVDSRRESRRWSLSPAIMAANGSGRPPGTYGVIMLGLLGLFSADAYATRRDSQKLSMQASEPLLKRVEASCPFRADLVKPQLHWLLRAISKSEQ